MVDVYMPTCSNLSVVFPLERARFFFPFETFEPRHKKSQLTRNGTLMTGTRTCCAVDNRQLKQHMKAADVIIYQRRTSTNSELTFTLLQHTYTIVDKNAAVKWQLG